MYTIQMNQNTKDKKRQNNTYNHTKNWTENKFLKYLRNLYKEQKEKPVCL